MSKALPCIAAPEAASHRSGMRVISDALWMACPVILGAGMAAAAWGQMSWWPSVTLGSLYALRVLRSRPQGVPAVEVPPAIELSSLGVIWRGDAALQAGSCLGLSWAEMTRVDVMTTAPAFPGDGIRFVLVADAQGVGTEARRVVVPGAQAVSAQLLQAMSTYLGRLDQTQLLTAISRRGEGQFTLWQRPAA
jgi:hypothetical protein